MTRINHVLAGFVFFSALMAATIWAMTIPAAAADLRLASWNIYWLGDNGNNQRTPADYVALRDVSKRLAADVVALQEVGDVETVAKVFPPAAYTIELSRRSGTQRTGFAIRKGVSYSRLDDVKTLNVTGSLRHGTVIDLHLAGIGDLRVVAVHMKSGCFAKDLDAPRGDACKKLQRQMAPLEEWIDAQLAAGVPLIVLGDFNRRMDIAGDDFWREVADGDPVPLYRVNAGVKPKCYGGKFGEFIDHIIVSPPAARLFHPGSFREVTYGDRPYADYKRLSDHCPISVDLADVRVADACGDCIASKGCDVQLQVCIGQCNGVKDKAACVRDCGAKGKKCLQDARDSCSVCKTPSTLRGSLPATSPTPMAGSVFFCCKTVTYGKAHYWWTERTGCKAAGGKKVSRSRSQCK